MDKITELQRFPVDDDICRLSGLLGPAGERFCMPEGERLGGEVFDVSGLDVSDHRPGVDLLLSRSLGWVLSNGIRFAPDTERLRKGVEVSGIGVEFIQDAEQGGEVPVELYGSVVLEGKHPIGVNNLEYYLHDISTDHIAAFLVAGEELIEVLLPNKKLFKARSLVEAAALYDESTDIISYDLDCFLRRALSGIIQDRILRYSVISPGNFSPKQKKARNEKVEALLLAGLERLEVL